MPTNKYTEPIAQLEKKGQFDVDIMPINEKLVKKMEAGKFKYRSKNIFYKIYEFLIRLGLWVLGPIVSWFLFDLRVRGKKNLKLIKKQGAIVVANHVQILDPLYLMQVSRTRQMYFLAAEFNNKKGLGGLTMRVAGVLPISSDFQLAKELDNTITYLLNKKKLITVYAEESLWMGYTKIRPLKNGAFHFAVKNNVPVVPVVALFRKTNWLDKIIFRKYKVTLQILPPVYLDDELKYKQKLLKMRDDTHNSMIECANNFYGTECDATKFVEESQKD